MVSQAMSNFFDNLECCMERAADPFKLSEQEATLDLDLVNTFKQELEPLFLKHAKGGNRSFKRMIEMQPMIKELLNIGFVFEFSDATLLTGRLWREYVGDDEQSISYEDVRDWFVPEVVSREENLRLLLQRAAWVRGVCLKNFKLADEDGSGTISLKELRKCIKRVYRHLGEPVPSTEDINAIAEEMIKVSDDGELEREDFQVALIELLVRVYSEHFNHSMTNPSSTHSLASRSRERSRDKDMTLCALDENGVPKPRPVLDDKWETGSVLTASSRLSVLSPRNRPAFMRVV